MLTETESDMIYYLADFPVRRHTVEFVWCKFVIDVFDDVTSSEDATIFQLTLKVVLKNRQGYTYNS